MVPVITVVTSAIVLKEQITGIAVVGTLMTLLGLFVSESKFGMKNRMNMECLYKICLKKENGYNRSMIYNVNSILDRYSK
jgi:hypothetical protein